VTNRTYLSIGDVLTLLRQEFPDVTISKIRFLESQGLVNPERSPSGYRKFYDHDVERLRWVLRQQREHFLPLKVIRDRLASEEGVDLPAPEAEPTRAGLRAVPEAPEEPEPHENGVVPGWMPEPALVSAPGPADPDRRGLPIDGGGTGGRSVGHLSPVPAQPTRTAATSSRPRPDAEAAGPRGESPRTSPGPSPAPSSARGTGGAEAGGSGHPADRPSATGPSAGGDDARSVAPAPGPAPGPAGRRPEGRSAPEAPDPPGGAGPGDPPTGGEGFSVSAGPTGASLTAEEITAATGLSATDLASLEGFGLVEPVVVAGILSYDEEALTVCRLAAECARYGIEPRHLRLYRNAADREAGLIEQIVTPLLRQRNPESKQRAVETATDLARLGQRLRAALLRRELQRLLGN